MAREEISEYYREVLIYREKLRDIGIWYKKDVSKYTELKQKLYPISERISVWKRRSDNDSEETRLLTNMGIMVDNKLKIAINEQKYTRVQRYILDLEINFENFIKNLKKLEKDAK